MISMEREKIWRISVGILCAISLLISALAFYGIKKLEAKSKPKVHLINEVHSVAVDRDGHPIPLK
jgi:hypothetical protein